MRLVRVDPDHTHSVCGYAYHSFVDQPASSSKWGRAISMLRRMQERS
jgi:hypothetical protein